jgi:hypothetical protein
VDIFVAFFAGLVVGGLVGSMFGFLLGIVCTGSARVDRDATVYAEGYADGKTGRG